MRNKTLRTAGLSAALLAMKSKQLAAARPIAAVRASGIL